MKRAAIAVIAVFICFSASAQKGQMAIGAHLDYGSGPTGGIGGKFQYGISDPFRIEASGAAFWGKKTYVTTNGCDLSLNMHYLFSSANFKRNRDKEIKNLVYFYPLVGLGYYKVTASTDFGGSTTELTEKRIGVNIGAGLENHFSERFSFFMEVKVGLGKDLSRFTALWGIAYHF